MHHCMNIIYIEPTASDQCLPHAHGCRATPGVWASPGLVPEGTVSPSFNSRGFPVASHLVGLGMIVSPSRPMPMCLLVWSWAGSHSCWEFTAVAPLPGPEDIVTALLLVLRLLQSVPRFFHNISWASDVAGCVTDAPLGGWVSKVTFLCVVTSCGSPVVTSTGFIRAVVVTHTHL